MIKEQFPILRDEWPISEIFTYHVREEEEEEEEKKKLR